jgi:hypothetical protein
MCEIAFQFSAKLWTIYLIKFDVLFVFAACLTRFSLSGGARNEITFSRDISIIICCGCLSSARVSPSINNHISREMQFHVKNEKHVQHLPDAVIFARTFPVESFSCSCKIIIGIAGTIISPPSLF